MNIILLAALAASPPDIQVNRDPYSEEWRARILARRAARDSDLAGRRAAVIQRAKRRHAKGYSTFPGQQRALAAQRANALQMMAVSPYGRSVWYARQTSSCRPRRSVCVSRHYR